MSKQPHRKQKQPQILKQRSIDQLQFQIIPQSINLIKKQSPTQQYYLYIEKGAQVLGKVQEVINTKSRNTYVFNKKHNIQFRIANDKNLTYQWSIYKYTADNNEQQYLQSVEFNIKQKYVQYLNDLEKRELDLYRIYLEKEKRAQIEQIWRDLRCDLTLNEVDMSCKFVRVGVSVGFRLVIKCDLDARLQKWEEEKEMRRLARTVNATTTRKGSVDSKNKISELSFYQSKEKIAQVQVVGNNFSSNNNMTNNNINDSQTLPINLLTERQNYYEVQNPATNEQDLQICSSSRKNQQNSNQQEQTKNQQQQYTHPQLYESQIRITDPKGIDVTDQIPTKYLNNKRIDINDYYYRKKSSMLSDIIQESYQGSSNVITKSNQGEKLKSVDEIHQQEETTPLFSPLIKTQNYDPQKDQEYFNRIKRTTTLVQRASQQFQLEQGPKMTPKRYSHYYPNVQPRNQLKLIPSSKQKSQSQLSISDTKVSSSRKSSFTQQQQNQIVKDLYYEQKTMIKNVSKVVIVLVILTIVIYFVGLFDDDYQGKKEKISNNNMSEKRKYKNNKPLQSLNNNKLDTVVIKKGQSKKRVKIQQQQLMKTKENNNK